MPNMYDYLDWRGDVPFSVDPFNEVDNLILSWLAYVDFEGVVPEPDWYPGSDTRPAEVLSRVEDLPSVGIREAAEQYSQLHTEEEIRERNTFIGDAPLLLPKVAAAERYAGLRLCGYVNLVDPERDLQMAAVTFEVGDGTWYAAYRGTDDTLAGWKEDFDLSFTEMSAGQAFATSYLESMFASPGRGVRVGGHSKGGNFAAYASVFCSDALRRRIVRVYSNDGPGFIESVADSDRFLSMLPKMIKIIPESSVIGILMNGHIRMEIVRSTKSGAMQHDPTSWEVERNHFARVDERSDLSIFFNETIIEWLNGITSEDRKLFVDNLFGLFESAGVTTLEEYREHRLLTAAALLKGFNQLPESHRKQFLSILRKLFRSGIKVLRERD